jgi:isochorismate hydrolase
MKKPTKNRYFTHDTIADESRKMLAALDGVNKRHRFAFAPDHAALLVLDMQRYFIEESSHALVPSAAAIIPNIKRLISSFTKSDRPVIFTRHVNTEEDARMMGRWWREVLTTDNPLSEITPELTTAGAAVLNKTQYDAFYRTALEDHLRQNEIARLVVTGVMTHLCVETTARSAFVRGFEVFLPIDGTATYTDAFHRSTLLSLSHGVAVPVLTKEIEDAFTKN